MFHETLAPKNTLDPGEGLEGRRGRVPVIQPFEIPLQHSSHVWGSERKMSLFVENVVPGECGLTGAGGWGRVLCKKRDPHQV